MPSPSHQVTANTRPGEQWFGCVQLGEQSAQLLQFPAGTVLDLGLISDTRSKRELLLEWLKTGRRPTLGPGLDLSSPQAIRKTRSIYKSQVEDEQYQRRLLDRYQQHGLRSA